MNLTASGTGNAGNALQFSGGKYVNIPHSASLALSNVTLQARVKPLSTYVYQGIVTKEPTGSSSQLGYGFRQRTNNTFWFTIGKEGWGASPQSTTILVPGIWYHLTGTYDGTYIKLYVNGVLESTVTYVNLVINSTAAIKIGILNSLSEAFNGSIYEVRVWNIVKTAEEIECNYNKSVDPASPGLFAYWRLNESSGNTSFDATSNANNGTLVNSPSRIASTASVDNYFSWNAASSLNTII